MVEMEMIYTCKGETFTEKWFAGSVTSAAFSKKIVLQDKGQIIVLEVRADKALIYFNPLTMNL